MLSLPSEIKCKNDLALWGVIDMGSRPGCQGHIPWKEGALRTAPQSCMSQRGTRRRRAWKSWRCSPLEDIVKPGRGNPGLCGVSEGLLGQH